DGTGAREPDLARDVAVIAHREIALVQRETLAVAELDELLDGRLDQAQPAVVAVQLDVTDEVLDRAETTVVLLGPDQLDVLPLVEDDLGTEVAHAQRYGLAVVAVGRVA